LGIPPVANETARVVSQGSADVFEQARLKLFRNELLAVLGAENDVAMKGAEGLGHDGGSALERADRCPIGLTGLCDLLTNACRNRITWASFLLCPKGGNEFLHGL